MLLPEIGEKGQELLRSSLVTICGVGGLGTPVAQYLTAAGVGRIRLVDPDVVEGSNLNRQILHWDEDCDASRPKVESAREKLERMSCDVKVQTVRRAIDVDNAPEILAGSNIVVDCLDNYESRFAVNRYCVESETPLVHAAVEGWRGQATVIIPHKTPCLACLVKKVPTVKRPIPVLGAVAGVMGCIEAVETVKLIVGVKEGLAGKLFVADLKDLVLDSFDLDMDPNCPICGRSGRGGTDQGNDVD
jgi:molybdopterin/thiamine biosynthesis adenylyltransferase